MKIYFLMTTLICKILAWLNYLDQISFVFWNFFWTCRFLELLFVFKHEPVTSLFWIATIALLLLLLLLLLLFHLLLTEINTKLTKCFEIPKIWGNPWLQLSSSFSNWCDIPDTLLEIFYCRYFTGAAIRFLLEELG